ncbi:hypothetical protein Q4519_11140 [Motilimonas sp. 1_MG-2023]|uniref:hypothetical protein n=1 Tax=Motilimonas sp. 1_MG-2023 TaxID=3062672 RepID=UPI0026E18F46|nr:hypothetical protein [Motilimonas sp. 1_MG-2023]MDO6526237.1 hypothetical protein [Motilimonas sp. 1_MG-2023]
MTSGKKLGELLPIAAFVTTGLALLCFGIATSFYRGIHAGYGVTASLPSEKELVFQGLILFLSSVPEIIIQGVIEMFSNWQYFFLGLLIGGVWYGVELVKAKGETQDIPKSNVDKFQHINSILGYIFIGIYVLLSLPATAFNKGEEIAKLNLNNLLEHGCGAISSNEWDLCTQVTYKEAGIEIKHEGLLIYKEGQSIALFKPNNSHIEAFRIPESAVLTRAYRAE